MKYPSEFPQGGRARVEAETLRAYGALEQDVRGIENWRSDVPFIHCVMRVFLVFVREACAFAKKSDDPAWSDRELDQQCRAFLLSIVIDAWEDKAKDLGIRKMFSSPYNWGYSLDDDARRKIEKSPEWKQYQELLLDAFDAQSAQVADCNSPQLEQAGETVLKTDVIESRASQDAVTPGDQAGSPTQGARRHGFEANMDRHKAIAEIVTRHAPTWRQGSTEWKGRVLPSICTDLDNAASLDESGLYEIPAPWREGGKTAALGGARANGWSDALQLGSKRLVIDQINTSLKMVLKRGSDS